MEEKYYRLTKVLKEFNVGTYTVREFLARKGIMIENDPNARLTAEQYRLVMEEFSWTGNKKEPETPANEKPGSENFDSILNPDKIQSPGKPAEIAGVPRQKQHLTSVSVAVTKYELNHIPNEGYLYISDLPCIFTENDVTHYEVSPGFSADQIARYVISRFPLKNYILNIETAWTDSARGEHKILDIIVHLRLRMNYMKPIYCVGFEPLDHILRRRPEDIVLCSPGINYSQLPLVFPLNASGHLLTDTEHLKPFYRPVFEKSLLTLRHRFANYSGMSFMMMMIKYIWKEKVAKDKDILTGPADHYSDYHNFKLSTEYLLMKTFYNVGSVFVGDFYREEYKIDIGGKRILLVDDMADKGWLNIIRMMITGDPEAQNVIAAGAGAFHPEGIGNIIRECKPHLLLLDLRLSDESGKMKAEDLDGYKILTRIKRDPDLQGLPVIIFTASHSAELTKRLLDSGADAVWTKPGYDEGLEARDIHHRYLSLLSKISEILGKYDDSRLERLNNNASVNDAEDRFEFLRILFFEKIRHLRSRIALHYKELQDHPLKEFPVIFIDTNVFAVGDGKRSEEINKQFSRTFCNFYLLVRISEKADYSISFEKGKELKKVRLSRIMIPNQVVDELLKLSKTLNPQQKKTWKRALLAYDALRELFDEGTVRTEINSYNDDGPLCILAPPLLRHADPVILEQIDQLCNGTPFPILKYEKTLRHNKSIHILNRDQSAMVQYDPVQFPVLLLTEDAELKVRASEKFPPEKVKTLGISQFNNIMDEFAKNL